MNKLAVIVVVALFLASAFAWGMNGSDWHHKKAEMPQKASGEIKRGEANDASTASSVEVNNAKKQRAEKKPTPLLGRPRKYIDKIPHTPKQWKEARERFIHIKEAIKTDMKAYIQAKIRLKQRLKNASSPEEREAIIKTYINNSITIAIKHIELVKSHIEASNMNDSVKAEILAKLDEHEAFLQEKQAELANVSGARLKDLKKELKQEWTKTKEELKQYALKGTCTSLMAVLKKAETAKLRFSHALENAEKRGINASEARTYFNEYKEKITEANTTLLAACSGSKNLSAKELREARHEIIEAYRSLHRAIRALKAKVHAEISHETKETDQEAEDQEEAASTAIEG